MGIITIGVDIGQRVDPTAIAVLEQDWRVVGAGKLTEDHYTARFLARLPLDTPYPAVASRLVEIIAGVRRQAALGVQSAGGIHVTLYMDATGVGQPVVDVMEGAGVGVPIKAVYFTHGDRRMVDGDGSIKLGKAWLVSRLQALLQTGRLHLPNIPEAEALAKELMDYEIRVDENANDKYGAFKVGTHDDLVTALGLAVQESGRRVHAPEAISFESLTLQGTPPELRGMRGGGRW